MKSLSRNKGRVHPGSPDCASVLKFLPLEVRNVSSSLNSDDSEVLAYLISFSTQADTHTVSCKRGRKHGELSSSMHKPSSSVHKPSMNDNSYSSYYSTESLKISQLGYRTASNAASQLRKPPVFGCSCFECYKSFWSRWDSSPNREKIGEAITLYEEHFAVGKDVKKRSQSGGDADLKGDKKTEGRGKGRRGHERHERGKQRDGSVLVGKNQISLVAKNSCAAGLVKEVQETGDQLRISSYASDVKAVIDGRSTLQSHTAARKIKPLHGGKEGPPLKDDIPGKLRSSKVAPIDAECQGTGFGLRQSDQESGVGADEAAAQSQASRKLVNFVAERIWGLWERKPKRMVDLY